MGFYVGYPEEPVADGHVVRDIGKTVFFTEEEAMAAVQKR